jgi:hypothetical protein
MMREVDNMIDNYGYDPPFYIGVLQNGRDWIFIFRTNVGINHRWNCVKTPPTFSNNPKEVSEANCETVARYLLYLIHVGDSIVDHMTSAEGTLLKAVSMMNVDEKDDSDADKSDDAGGDTRSRDDTNRDGMTDHRTRSMVGKAQSIGGAGRGKGSSKITQKRDTFRGGNDVFDKENLENTCLKLTLKNVSRIPLARLMRRDAGN